MRDNVLGNYGQGVPDEASQVGVGVTVGASGRVGVGVSVNSTGSVAVGVSVSISEGVPANVGVLLGALVPPLQRIAISVAVGNALLLSGSFTLKASAYWASAPQLSPVVCNCSATWMVASAQRLVALKQDESDIFV